MNLVDRFTRDRISRLVWGVCLVIALALLALAVVRGRAATDVERESSETRASGYATAVVQPAIAQAPLDGPLDVSSLEQLTLAVNDGILVDERVVAVRVWSTDGRMLFSTEPDDTLGDARALNDEQIRAALAQSDPVTISERSSAEDPTRTSELISYVRVASAGGSEAVVEVVQDIDAAIGEVRGDWLTLQLLAGGLALGLLVMTILSFREPFARVGAGVGFVAEAVPPGYAVIEEDRVRAINDVYALAQERVDRLKERLRASEHARLATEGELQRMLSRFEPPSRRTAPAPVLMHHPDPEPAVEPEPVPTVAIDPAPEPAAATDLAPGTASADLPAVDEPTQHASTGPDTEPEPVLAPEPAVVAQRPVGPTLAGLPDLVGLDDDEDDAEIARELLLRLMETEVPMADTGVDPGEVRARLVRTAARKKPGGGDRKIVEDESRTPPWARAR